MRQMYSYLGIVIIVLMVACILYIVFHEQEIEAPVMSPEETVLLMQCDQKHGVLAVSHGSDGRWIECYQGRKKVWGVKL